MSAILKYAIIFITGFGVSFVSNVFGFGGAIIMVPVLSLLLPCSHLEAMATSLMTIVLVASLNTFNFHRRGLVVWRVVPLIAAASATCAFVFARISLVVPEKILIGIFLLMLLYFAIRIFVLKRDDHSSGVMKKSPLISLGIGSLSGTLSGLTGVGGGGITTPLMLTTGLTGDVEAAPTANAIMIFTSFFASLSFALAESSSLHPFKIGYIHLDSALLLFLGSALFSPVGVRINLNFPPLWRRRILGTILLLVCIRLVEMLVNS
jgi:uncharacterized membrane protein YfcA